MQELPLALTFDDVLLVPRRSRISSRGDVSTRAQLTRTIALEIPVLSANMDTVTTAPMAIALAQLGGLGVIHRFLSVEDEVAEVVRVKRFRSRVISDPHTIAPGASARRGAGRSRAPGRLGTARRGSRRPPGAASSRRATCARVPAATPSPTT